jgi:ribose transport system substrate-binding protein
MELNIAAALETLSKTKGFNAVMVGTLLLLSGFFWTLNELLDSRLLAVDEQYEMFVVLAVIALLACPMWIALKWQTVNRVAFKSKHVFVALPSLADEPFHVKLLNGIVQALTPEYTVTLWLPRESEEYQGSAFEEFLTMVKKDSAMYVGGIVLPTVVDHERPERLVELAKAIDLPVVLVDTLPEVFVTDTALPPGHKFIGFDNTEGGRQAAGAMVRELGKTASGPGQVLVLHAKEQTDRHKAFIAELSELCPRLTCQPIECGWSRETARAEIKGRADEGKLKNCEGIFASNDEMAVGAIEALSKIDKPNHVRQDIVVIGYDGSPTALALLSLGSTPLRNVVVQDGYKLGVRATAQLRALIRQGDSAKESPASQPILLKPRLHHR